MRHAIDANGYTGPNIVPFQPELTLPLPFRVSQVAFSSDERFLVVCGEESGGIGAFEVDSLSQSSGPTIQLSTNSLPVRAIAPNPAPENGYYFAIVLNNGQLVLADLNSKTLPATGVKEVLFENVTCISWSVRGKALIAGLKDGNAVQLKANGDVMAQIPRAPHLEGDQHGRYCALVIMIHSLTPFQSPPSTGLQTTT